MNEERTTSSPHDLCWCKKRRVEHEEYRTWAGAPLLLCPGYKTFTPMPASLVVETEDGRKVTFS